MPNWQRNLYFVLGFWFIFSLSWYIVSCKFCKLLLVWVKICFTVRRCLWFAFKRLSHRGSEALRVLDRGELPGGVQPVRSERHPLQPREPPERSVQVPMGGGRLAPGRDACVCACARVCAWVVHVCCAARGRFTSAFNDASVGSRRWRHGSPAWIAY